MGTGCPLAATVSPKQTASISLSLVVVETVVGETVADLLLRKFLVANSAGVTTAQRGHLEVHDYFPPRRWLLSKCGAVISG